MRLFAVARLSTCLLLGLAPALLGHCGGATTTLEPGTETGNPPRVDAQKLRLVASANGAELTGEPGAVSPGASVRLENRSTGASAVVTADSDGSFRVTVPGAALDDYAATVTEQGRTATVAVAPRGDDGNLTGSGLSALSCQQLESALVEQLDLTFAPAASGCTSDSDCRIQYWNIGCYEQCGHSYVTADQQASALAAAGQSLAPLCSELERCSRPLAPECDQGATPQCYQGSCRALRLDDLSCEDLSSRAGQLAAAAIADVDRSCNVDADCAGTSVSLLSCAPTCGFGGAVAASAVAGLQQQMTAIEADLCGLHSGRGCAPSEQLPCLPAGAPTRVLCLDNRCATEAP